MSEPAALEEMPNLGAEAAGWLRAAGIDSPAELQEVGSVGAYLACSRTFDEWSGWHVLYAFEGAIRGVRWHAIPRDERDQLRARAEAELQRT